MLVRFLFTLYLLHLCWAKDVTVLINDTRLTWDPTPPSDAFEDCGGIRWLNASITSVTLSFTGTAVSINFFHHLNGAKAQMSLDGTILTPVDTYQPLAGLGAFNCTPFPWMSGNHSLGPHTFKVTYDGSGHPLNIINWLPMTGFVYTEPDGPPLSSASTSPSASPSTTGHQSPTVGVIAGATIGGFVALLLLVVGVLCLRRRRKFLVPIPGILDEDGPDATEKPAAQGTVPGISGSDGPDFQSGSLPFMEQYARSDSTAIASPILPAGSFDAVAGGKSQSSAPPPTTLQTTENSMATPYTSLLPSTLSQMSTLRPDSQLPERGTPPLTPPLTSPANVPNTPPLSQIQLDFLHKLSEQNVPGPALATVIESMARGTGSAVGEERHPVQDTPPGYDFKG